MDIESNSSSSSSELSEDIIEDNLGNESNIENWITYNDEKIFWNKAQEKNLTYQPKICPKCNFWIFEKKNTKAITYITHFISLQQY